MAYNPSFSRSSKGQFDPNSSFIGVKAGTDAYLLEDEINEMQANLLNMTRVQMQGLFTSGPLTTITGIEGKATDVMGFDKFRALVDGLVITVGGADKSGADTTNSNEKNYVKMNAKPASGTRTDLVFLEVFEAEVNNTSTLYKYGTLGGKTLTNNLQDVRVGAETTRRIQLQGDLRTVDASAAFTDALGGVYTNQSNGLFKSTNGRLAIKLFTIPRTSGEAALNTSAIAAVYECATMLAPQPTQDSHVATKQYVDVMKQGLDFKDSVRVATTLNIPLSGTPIIDGVQVNAGDRVLVKDQTNKALNGIYVANSSTWTRAADVSPTVKVTPGMYCFVEEGNANGDSAWVLATNGTITVGTTELTFVQFSGAGQITATGGLIKAGNELSVDNGGITTAKVANGAITADKVATGAITTDKVVNGAITTDKVLDGSITGAKLATGAVAGHLGFTPLNPAVAGTMTAPLSIFGSLPTGVNTADAPNKWPGEGMVHYLVNNSDTVTQLPLPEAAGNWGFIMHTARGGARFQLLFQRTHPVSQGGLSGHIFYRHGSETDASWGNWHKMFHEGNDGVGSGLNAEQWADRKYFKQTTAPVIGTSTGQAQAGDEWYNTTSKTWNYCNGTTWIEAPDRRYFKQPTMPTTGTGTGQAQAGDEWYNTSTNRLFYYNGTTWVDPLKYQ